MTSHWPCKSFQAAGEWGVQLADGIQCQHRNREIVWVELLGPPQLASCRNPTSMTQNTGAIELMKRA